MQGHFLSENSSQGELITAFGLPIVSGTPLHHSAHLAYYCSCCFLNPPLGCGLLGSWGHSTPSITYYSI